jgi:hypothetical protein
LIFEFSDLPPAELERAQVPHAAVTRNGPFIGLDLGVRREHHFPQHADWWLPGKPLLAARFTLLQFDVASVYYSKHHEVRFAVNPVMTYVRRCFGSGLR